MTTIYDLEMLLYNMKSGLEDSVDRLFSNKRRLPSLQSAINRAKDENGDDDYLSSTRSEKIVSFDMRGKKKKRGSKAQQKSQNNKDKNGGRKGTQSILRPSTYSTNNSVMIQSSNEEIQSKREAQACTRQEAEKKEMQNCVRQDAEDKERDRDVTPTRSNTTRENQSRNALQEEEAPVERVEAPKTEYVTMSVHQRCITPSRSAERYANRTRRNTSSSLEYKPQQLPEAQNGSGDSVNSAPRKTTRGDRTTTDGPRKKMERHRRPRSKNLVTRSE